MQDVKPVHKRTARIVVRSRHNSRIPELYRTGGLPELYGVSQLYNVSKQRITVRTCN